MSSTPAQQTDGRKGLTGFLLQPTRVPATLQVISLVLLVAVLATAHLTLMDALLLGAAGVVFAAIAVRLVLGMRARYGEQDQQEESRDMAQAKRMPFFSGAWKALGSQRVPLVWLLTSYATVVYVALSLKYPWLP